MQGNNPTFENLCNRNITELNMNIKCLDGQSSHPVASNNKDNDDYYNENDNRHCILSNDEGCVIS